MFPRDKHLIKSSKLEFKWTCIIPIMGLIFALWLPFGFSLTALIEEWGLLGLFTHYGHFYISDINSPLAAHAIRPLTSLPHAIGYFLDPNSFHYWHILLILSFLIKGLSANLLIWQTTSSKYWATIAGLLILVYPADTMQFAFRALHINWGLTLLLLATSLLITAFRTHKPIKAHLIALISATLLWAALAMYEASLSLVAMPFFLMYIREGIKNSLDLWNSRKGLVVLWFFSISLYLIYVVIVSNRVSSYEHQLLSHQSFINILFSKYPKLFAPGLTRSLAGGWFDATQILLKEISWLSYLYLFIIVFLLMGLINYSLKKDSHTPSVFLPKIIVLIRLAAGGILLAILGYVPYLVCDSHLLISQRTFLFATPGAVLFWIALLMILAKWKKNLAVGLSIMLLLIGLAFQLFQFHHYVELSERQRTILRNIVTYFDKDSHHKTLILLDEGNQLNQTWMFPEGNLKWALTYFFEKTIKPIEICFMPGKEWSTKDNLARSGHCIEEQDRWVFRAATLVKGPGYTPQTPSNDKIILKKDAVVLIVKPDGSVANTAELKKQNLLALPKNQEQRYQKILTPSTWTSYFNKLWFIDSSKYKWSFGNWWSMDLPTQGSGWRPSGWTVGKFFHHASSLKTQEDASLLFDFAPKKQVYLLKGKFNFILNEEIRKSIKIFLNQHEVLFQLTKNGAFEAKISNNILLHGVNTLMIHSTTDPNYFGLSLSLSKFEILPE